jgi:hypothetical protein
MESFLYTFRTIAKVTVFGRMRSPAPSPLAQPLARVM